MTKKIKTSIIKKHIRQAILSLEVKVVNIVLSHRAKQMICVSERKNQFGGELNFTPLSI